jgi:putative membrane protein insertion efficiency factor
MTRLWTHLRHLPAAGLVILVRGYQCWISPLLGHNCRFRPTCSDYFVGAVRKYGAVRGTLRGAWRICRCQPFCRGGDDPP